MSDEQIKNFIINTLVNEGYGWTAAELQVNQITESLVAAAYEKGRSDRFNELSLNNQLR